MLFGKTIETLKSLAWTGRAVRALDGLSLAFAALVAGARSVPLGDNGALLRELAAHAEAIRAARVVGARAAGCAFKDR